MDKLKNLKVPNFKLWEWESETKGRIGAKNIMEMVSDPTERQYIICGPTAMMHQIRNGLIEAGVKPERISLEDFALK